MTLKYSDNEVYDNPALSAYYEFGNGAMFNPMELRIHYLYDRMKIGIKPWEWDWLHYGGENSDMVGFYYPEDINAVDQIRNYEREREMKARK